MSTPADPPKMFVKQFAEQVANIASDVYCDGGARINSHKVPSSVEVWCENDLDADFEVLRVEPDRLAGCGCWSGIRIIVKRTNPDSPPSPVGEAR